MEHLSSIRRASPQKQGEVLMCSLYIEISNQEVFLHVLQTAFPATLFRMVSVVCIFYMNITPFLYTNIIFCHRWWFSSYLLLQQAHTCCSKKKIPQLSTYIQLTASKLLCSLTPLELYVSINMALHHKAAGPLSVAINTGLVCGFFFMVTFGFITVPPRRCAGGRGEILQ